METTAEDPVNYVVSYHGYHGIIIKLIYFVSFMYSEINKKIHFSIKVQKRMRLIKK